MRVDAFYTQIYKLLCCNYTCIKPKNHIWTVPWFIERESKICRKDWFAFICIRCCFMIDAICWYYSRIFLTHNYHCKIPAKYNDNNYINAFWLKMDPSLLKISEQNKCCIGIRLHINDIEVSKMGFKLKYYRYEWCERHS